MISLQFTQAQGLQGTHTYTTDAMHTLLDHTLLGHVVGGKWPGDETKTMPCIL